jgi:hypothetical protein
MDAHSEIHASSIKFDKHMPDKVVEFLSASRSARSTAT